MFEGTSQHEANMQKFLDTNTGTKYDSERPDMSLLSSFAIEELAKALTVGKKKYAAHNWRKGISISRLIAAALRHTFALLRGEDKDPETGLYHASQVMCNMMFILETMKYHSEMDDRFVVVNRNIKKESTINKEVEVLHQSV